MYTSKEKKKLERIKKSVKDFIKNKNNIKIILAERYNKRISYIWHIGKENFETPHEIELFDKYLLVVHTENEGVISELKNYLKNFL